MNIKLNDFTIRGMNATTMKSHQKFFAKFDPKILRHSIILYFVLLIPLSMAHEYGHHYACTTAGHSSNVGITIGGMWTSCTPDLNTLEFSILGPVFGTVAAGGLFAGGWFSKKRSFAIVGISYLVDQVMKVGLEGFVTELYVGRELDILITVVQIAALFGAIMWLGKRNGQTQKKHIDLHHSGECNCGAFATDDVYNNNKG